MARKQKRRADRLAVEAHRRAVDAARKADDMAVRVARIMAEIRRRYLADLRRELAEAAQRHRAQELLAAALAPESPFPWQPWGYEQPEEPAVRPMVPQLRLVHSRNTLELPIVAARRKLVAA